MNGCLWYILVLVALVLLGVPGGWIILIALSCGFLFADY
jgi:hypothetical protein